MDRRPSACTLRIYSDLDSFERVALPFLMLHEAQHCLQLGLLSGMREGEWHEPFLAVLERRGEPLLIAMRTPPHNLLLSRAAAGVDLGTAMLPLLEGIAQAPPGVLAPVEVGSAFVEAWAAARGSRARLEFRQRIYRLDRAEPVPGVRGAPRRASATDRPLVAEWMAAFLREALPGKQSDPVTTADRWLASTGRELWLWEADGAPVAMAGAGGGTPNGIRVSAVYTPPSERRRGYASALVADLSARLLAAGRRFCFLFTDLSNPTSNRIYQRIGYRPVGDANEYRFEEPG